MAALGVAASAMNAEILIALLNNAALLLAVVTVYDLVTHGRRVRGRFWRQVGTGLVVGALGIALILTAYRLETGIVFDTRSVLLVTSGLFFGTIPTVVAMAMAAAVRLMQGGVAAVPGVMVIFTTGTLGIIWGRLRRGTLEDIRWTELYVMGLLAHLAMVALMFLLPREAALRVVGAIGLPVMLIHPVATVALGLLLHDVSQRRRIEAERERLLADARETGVTLRKALEDREKSERARAGAEDQLRQVQKMESVGRLAGGVAHDFNNNLQVILGYCEQLVCSPGLSGNDRVDLHEIQNAAERSASLTRQLLAFARRQTIVPRILDLNDAIAGMLKMLSRLLGENIQLSWSPGPGLGTVELDPSQVDQIMANLCVNARDAISGAGTIAISTRNVDLDPEFCAAHPGTAPGPHVQVSVRDDGCGMDPETLSRAFEPFFTTKDIGQGTGLGLATVYGIVRQNRGAIEVESAPGSGTVFRISFPRVVASVATPRSGATTAPLDGLGTTVLLVEDDPAVLEIVRSILASSGFEVLAARTPREALPLARTSRDRIRLLVSDVVMPEMSGRELADLLRASMPGLPCLFMSGYPSDALTRGGILDEGVHFIEKPFTRAAFDAKLRSVFAALSGSPVGERKPAGG